MFQGTEADLAAVVVEWLQEQHWTVYQEVQVFRGSSVADIVATQGRLVWIIECKRSLGLAVMRQAQGWRFHAHYVSVAVPFAPDTRGERGYAIEVLRERGIGVLCVGEPGRVSISEVANPTLYRRADTKYVRGVLCEQQQTYAAAGSTNGRHWSEYQATCQNLAAYVREHPGALLSEAIRSIQHHYGTPSTARSCLKQWLEYGKVRGVRLERDGRYLRLYPEVNQCA